MNRVSPCTCEPYLPAKMAGHTKASDKYQSLMTDRGLLTSLMEAAAKGEPKVLHSVIQEIEKRYADQLQEGGIATKADVLLGFRDGNGRTVAHFAALGGSRDSLELLIQLCPAAVKSRDNSGKTPLFISATLGDLASIELLLDNGAEVNTESEGGSTPLHEAVSAGKAAAVKLLLERGATVSQLVLRAGL